MVGRRDGVPAGPLFSLFDAPRLARWLRRAGEYRLLLFGGAPRHQESAAYTLHEVVVCPASLLLLL